jgi:hypothetical protein
MNNDGQIIVMRGICRPDGAGLLAGARATKMPLLTELGGSNDVRFLRQL